MPYSAVSFLFLSDLYELVLGIILVIILILLISDGEQFSCFIFRHVEVARMTRLHGKAENFYGSCA